MKPGKGKLSRQWSKLRPHSRNGLVQQTTRCYDCSKQFNSKCECRRNDDLTEMWKIVAISVVAALFLYINTIYADFAYDDSRAILKNQDLLPETPLANIWKDDFWGTPLRDSGSHKSYRPLVVLTFRLNYFFHQLSPGGYHLVNVILHSIATGLYTATVGVLGRKLWVTVISGVLFAVHPIHTEAVAGVVGRADILCAVFFLLSILTFRKYCELVVGHTSRVRYGWIAATFTLVTASTLSKELGITVLGVCFVYYIICYCNLTIYDLLPVGRSTVKLRQHAETVLLLVLFGVVLLITRLYFMGYSPPSFSPADNPAANSTSFLTRCLTFLYLPVFNFWLLVYPVTLSFDWSMDAIPLVESVWDYRVAVIVLFYSSLVLSVKYSLTNFLSSSEISRKPLISQEVRNGLNGYKKLCQSDGNHQTLTNGGVANGGTNNRNGIETVTFRRLRKDSSSSSESVGCDENFNEVETVGTPTYHRHYSTLVLGLSLLIIPFLPATNLPFYVGFVVAERILYIPSMGYCLLVAEAVYQIFKKLRHQKLYRVGLYTTLTLLCVLLSLRCYSRCLDWTTEERLYTSGIAVNPAKAWGNLANVLNNRGEVDAAEQAYKSALSHRSNMADVHYNLGILLQGQSRYKEALEAYDLAIQCRPRLTVAHLNKGIVLALMGKHSEAKQAYTDCSEIDISGLKDPRMHESAKVSAMYNLGRLYAEQKDYPAAISTYNLALEMRPNHYAPYSIYNLLGEAYFQSNDLEAAEKAYRKSLYHKADHAPAHLTMARLMSVKKNFREAERLYEKAIQINDKDAQSLHHYALYLAERNRHAEALVLWQKAVDLSPLDFDITFNLASALRHVGRNKEAIYRYETAAKLSPESATAHMNLGAMYHINANYSLALKSYSKALELDPHNQVTKNNLRKLQNIMNKAKR